PSIVGKAVRFTAEADSLNCSILGADAAPGSSLFELYVKQIVKEMTVKAGQKCTAIRRALVPAEMIDPVLEAISGRLAKVKVGNPANPDVRMGSLASLEQREEFRESLGRLSETSEIVFGSDSDPDVVDADPEKGAFVSPVLLRCDDKSRP